MGLRPFQGIIFDMDNTLLKSKIDFDVMKKEVYHFLLNEGFIESCSAWQEKTASQWIEEGRKHPSFHHKESLLWELVSQVEAEGMKGAQLEPGVLNLLSHLKEEGKVLIILTNNAFSAARKALEELSIYHLFDGVLGREHMETLKPSPSGIQVIMDRWREIPHDKWVFIGDSWIDGMAAKKAGIAFVAYGTDLSHFQAKDIHPIKTASHLNELLN